jgi:signal peptidase I
LIRLPQRANRTIRIAAGGTLALVSLRLLACQAYHIPSRSMEDTLLVGDFLLVEKLSYGAKLPLAADLRLPGWRAPRRGDIVVFQHPLESRDYVKRCVGVAGDLLELRQGVLYRNGAPQREPYRRAADASQNFAPLRVPAGHVFVLGDQRQLSRDSRVFGPLPLSNLRGRAALIYYSWDAQARRVRWSRTPLSLL